jgi:hypothetical protein
MNPTQDVIFDVSCFLTGKQPDLVREEKVTFVNISYEKIQEAMAEAFDSTGVEEVEDAEIFLNELANRLNTKGNTIAWRGKVMKMNFFVE